MGSKVYDNWEKLVVAVERKEQLRELARCESIATSTISDGSSRFSFSSITSIKFYDHLPPTSTKSFFVMAGATNFSISCEKNLCLGRYTGDGGFNPGDGDFNEFRYFEAVKLKSESCFDIRAKIKTSMLSNVTVYGAYMVYKLLKTYTGGISDGPRSAKAMIRYDNYESDAHAESRAQVVKILGKEDDQINDKVRRRRKYGWMEVQLGSFYIGNGDYEEVEARLFANESTGDGVLEISGIEFRPLVGVTDA